MGAAAQIHLPKGTFGSGDVRSAACPSSPAPGNPTHLSSLSTQQNANHTTPLPNHAIPFLIHTMPSPMASVPQQATSNLHLIMNTGIVSKGLHPWHVTSPPAKLWSSEDESH